MLNEHNTKIAPNGQDPLELLRAKILDLAAPAQPQQTDNQITQEWLQAKVDHYQAEVIRLERELIHARASLKGHQVWLAEVQQKAGER